MLTSLTSFLGINFHSCLVNNVKIFLNHVLEIVFLHLSEHSLSSNLSPG